MTLNSKFENLRAIRNCRLEAAHLAPKPELCTPEIFFEKYKDANTITMSRLKTDLHSILNDVLWLQESGNADAFWAIDFLDALNNLSTRI